MRPAHLSYQPSASHFAHPKELSIVNVPRLLFVLLTLAAASGPPASCETPLSREARAERDLPKAVVDATLAYASGTKQPILSSGYTRQYAFGGEAPTLECAPLRVCAIVLEAGETVIDLLGGDTVQWKTYVASTGAGGGTPVVGVRPYLGPGDTCDKTANLLITTDRRIYHVILRVPPCSPEESSEANPERPFASLVSFYYPDDVLRRLSERAELRRRAEETKPKPPRLLGDAPSVEALNWDYQIRGQGFFGRRMPFRPVAVFDDGSRTYIQLPAGLPEAPLVFHGTEGGELALVNSNLDGELLVVDRVLEHLVLSLGRNGAKKPRQLHIRRGGEERAR